MNHLRNQHHHHHRVNDHFIVCLFNRSMKTILEPKITAPLRETGRIAVNFTSRIFPTPMRESQTEVEEQVGHNFHR